MEYYSAIKKNKILPFIATWMDLEDIMLSEISQTEKDKYWGTSLAVQWLGFRTSIAEGMGSMPGQGTKNNTACPPPQKKDKYCMLSLICGIKKLQQTSEYNKKDADSQTQRTK